MAWGINNGFLEDAIYRPVVEKAWNGMVADAVHPDGKLGYVQASAAEPCNHFPVGYEDTTDFGVGAFLLAGSEVVKMAGGTMPIPLAWYSSTDWSAAHDLGLGNIGRMVVEFDITPADAPTDGLVGYADSDTTVDWFDEMAVIVRMFHDLIPRFEAYDGNGYAADENLEYVADTTYHVKIGVDVDEGIYDVWVTPDAGSTTKIADDYRFRSTADDMDDLGKAVLKNDPIYQPFILENHTVSPTCSQDYDYDRDADGGDLAELINDFDPNKLLGFAAEFGQLCP